MLRGIALSIGIGFLAGFLMIEAFLRFDDYSAQTVDYVYHEWDGRERRVMATDEELADPRRAIVVLGDSMTAGVNCGRDNNLVGRFEQAMQTERADYKTINLGSANTSVFSYLDQLRGYEAAYGAPAGVIVMLYANDADVVEPRLCPVIDVVERTDRLTAAEKDGIRGFCEKAAGDPMALAEPPGLFAIGGPVDIWLYEHSYAFRFFREAWARVAVYLADGAPIGRLRYPMIWSDPESETFRTIEAGMAEIKAIADRDGVPMMVAFYPPVEFLSKDNPMYPATEIAIAALEKALGVPVLNGFDAYFGDPRAGTNMSRSLTDHHPSCVGHQILAEWLVKKYEEAGGFREIAVGDGAALSRSLDAAATPGSAVK